MRQDLIEKAVWLPDLVHVRNSIRVLRQLYDRDTWLGGMVFSDTTGGFLFIATFDPDRYDERRLAFEALFSEKDLRSVTYQDACGNGKQYRPWLRGEICQALRRVRLLPVDEVLWSEREPSLAEVQLERDPPEGLP
jgi:hypothetical protein